MKNRKVYLVGAGPGKADLITVRGKKVLEQADVVVYDYLVDDGLLNYARGDAELICSGKLAHKGKYSYGHPVDQGIIDRIVLEKVNEGKKVVRLKNGDPAFFSRFTEELRALLQEGIEFEAIPGVTAAGAASSLCGIPLTDRDHASSCAFAAGHENPGKEKTVNDWKVLSNKGTLVVYMGVSNLKKIVNKLLEAGKVPGTPVAIIKDISLISQKVIKGTLENITRIAEETGLKPPAIIIIGEVAGLEKDLNWSKRNKRVLFTGLSDERYFIEGNYVHLPLITIEPIDDYNEFDKAIGTIEDFDWLIFTSRYGVEYFFERLKFSDYDARDLHRTKIAVIGQSTGEKLNGYSIEADLMPTEESSKGLVEEFKKIDLSGRKIFMPRSDISDKGMEKELEAQGAEVTALVAYRNVMPEKLPDIDFGEFDEIMFTSPSTVRNFIKRYGKVPKNIKVTHIGDVTLREAEKCQLQA